MATKGRHFTHILCPEHWVIRFPLLQMFIFQHLDRQKRPHAQLFETKMSTYQDRHWCHSHGKSSFILYTNWTVVKACERGYAMPSVSSSWCMYCNHCVAGKVEQACTNVPLVKFFFISLWSVLSDRQARGTPLGPIQDRSPGVPYHWDAASVLPSRELQGRQGESDVSDVTLWIMSHAVRWLICNMMSWWLV